MDIDNAQENDFDGKFFDAFRSMGTCDKDDLITEFQSVIGNSVNRDSCAFFLEMNNWNVQNAIGSYYDCEMGSMGYGSPASPALTCLSPPLAAPLLPSMLLVADVTVGHPAAVAPGTLHHRAWRLRNSGPTTWPPGCHLRLYTGMNLATVERRMVSALAPGEETTITVEMRSPEREGSFLSCWRMCTPTGAYFGDDINIHTVVENGGMLALTQQMARFGPEVGQLATPDAGYLATQDAGVPGVVVGVNVCNSAMEAQQEQGQQMDNEQNMQDDDTEMS